MAFVSSRDVAVADPLKAARRFVREAAAAPDLQQRHERAWEQLWGRNELQIAAPGGLPHSLRADIFHLLQTLSPQIPLLDVGAAGRGLHGEEYFGHVFWDQVFVTPWFNLHVPEISQPSVKYVQKLGEGHYRWALRLPAGQDLELEDRVTESVPHERLSWESVSNRPASYMGTVVLQREGDNATRVNVHFEYTPPGGALADALGSLFGLDAESKFQDAVVRIKTFLETGHPPHDVHEVSPEVQGGHMG